MASFQWLETISAGQSAILVAVGVGMIGLIVAFCFSSRDSSSKDEDEAKSEVEEVSSDQSAGKARKTELGKKQWKEKNTGKPKKSTLPSHPLLAADFKGHTGAVLSIDFDNTGRYLVSCSDGMYICILLIIWVER